MLNKIPTSIERQTFEQFLGAVKALMVQKNIQAPSGFISYAWESDSASNKILQDWLTQLKEDFDQLGIALFLDIQHMNGDMQACMRLIQQKDFVFLIGTPRYKERASQSSTNVAFEFGLILEKKKTSPHSLMPLLLQGDFDTAFPPGISAQNLIRDCRESSRYVQNFVGLSPLGLLPAICPALQNDADYKKLVNDFLDWNFDAWLQKVRSGVNEDLQLYIPARGDVSPECRNPRPMEEHVQAFLGNNAAKVMLILGGSGSGKSMLGQYLLQQGAQAFQSAPQQYYTPVWISLPALQNPKGDAIREGLQSLGVPESHISAFKQKRLLIILDAYDEVKDLGNLYDSNHLEQWPHAKVMITCRSEFLTAKNYSLLFKPKNSVFIERYMAPFSAGEITAYLEKYIAHQKPRWGLSHYQAEIDSLPALKQMIETPFLLRIVADVLPDIADKYHRQNQNEHVTLTRRALYDRFIDQWFEKHLARWEEQQKLPLLDEGLGLDEDDKLGWSDQRIKVLRDYAEHFAQELYRHQLDAVSPKATQEYPWVKALFDAKPRAKLIRSACPLKKTGEDSYGFIHKSLLEYLVTPMMVKEMRRQSKAKQHDTELSTSASNEFFMSGAVSTISPDCLNQQLLTPAIVQFLADAIAENPDLQSGLWSIVNSSKRSNTAIAAANALTILNRAKVNLSGLDLGRIRIPGANLNGAILDNTTLEGADLTNVTFIGAWLHGTSFENALMTGVDFGEYTPILLKDRVFGCCYSPDSRYLAVSVSTDIELYDTSTRSLVRTFNNRYGSSNSTHFSPDSKWLAACQGENIAIWNVDSGLLYKILEGHTEGKSMYSVYFSPDGKLLASGCEDNTVKLWSVETGLLQKKLEGHTHTVWSVAFSPDGRYLFSGGRDKLVKQWFVDSGFLQRTLVGHTDGVRSIHVSPVGDILASGGDDKAVRLWSIETGILLHTLRSHTKWILNIQFSPDGKLLASGSCDHTVKLWSVETGELLRTLEGHTSNVDSVQFSPEGNILATAGNTTIMFWDINFRVITLQGTIGGHTNIVESIHISSDGKMVASGGDDNTVKLWLVEKGVLHKTFEGHTSIVESVQFSPNARILASGSKDRTIKLWSVDRGLFLKTLVGHTDTVTSVHFTSDGMQLVSGSLDNTIKFWAIATGDLIKTLKNSSDTISCVQFSPDGKLLASGSGDKRVALVLMSTTDETIKLWSVANGELLNRLEGHSDTVNCIHFSPNGKFLASGSKDKTIKLWALDSGKLLKNFEGHTGFVNGVHFSPNGTLLASASQDNTIRLWCNFNANKNNIGYVTEVSSSPNSISFSQKGEKIFFVSGHDDYSVRYWQLVNFNNKPYLQLIWASHQNALLTQDANIVGARELSDSNVDLLKQRGAFEKHLLYSTDAKTAFGYSKPKSRNKAKEKATDEEFEETYDEKNKCVIC